MIREQKFYDHSDRIAYVQVCLEILTDLDPQGSWTSNPILEKWSKDHYALTKREFAQLETFLESERERVTSLNSGTRLITLR